MNVENLKHPPQEVKPGGENHMVNGQMEPVVEVLNCGKQLDVADVLLCGLF